MDTHTIRILVVEDDEAHAELIRRAFAARGDRFDLTAARSLAEARPCLAINRPDLVVTDLSLPDGRGTELLSASGEKCPFPLVVMTGHGNEQVAVEAIKAGALEYVVKSAATLNDLPRVAERALREWGHIAERRGAEEALRENEARLSMALEVSNAGQWQWNTENDVVCFDARFHAMLGYAPGELPNTLQEWKAYHHPEDLPVMLSRAEAYLHGDSPIYESEHRIRAKAGTWNWVFARGKLVNLTTTGCSKQFTGIAMDITERKRAEEALRQSERKKTILNQIANIFLTVPDDEMYGKVLAVVLEVMQSKFGILGFIGEDGDLVIPSLTREVWKQCQVADKSIVFPTATWGESLWGRAIREKKTFGSDGPFHTPEGHIRIDRFLAVPIVFGSETIGVISVANGERRYTDEDTDLLESISSSISPILNARLQRDRQEQRRKSAEEKLRKLSRAVEHSPASIVITDVAGTIEYVNPKFSAVTGYSQAEAVGQNPRILKSGEMPSEQYQQMWQTIASGKEWRGEFHNRKKNGELYWELASISPIFDAAGDITHYLAVKEDITEHKRLEGEFRQAQKMEAFGQLAGGVAHDFNNVLAIIQGNAALFQMGGLSGEEQANALEQISVAVERAARLTRQLLMFSRRQVVQLKDLDLNEVVLNMTKMLQRLIGEHISLAAHYAPGGAPVHADPGMMEQVLMNLAVNSRDAMPRGGQLGIQTEILSVDEDMARTNPKARPGRFVRLSVSDTGSGIAPEHLPHVFEPFFTTKDVGKGTGLGLATVFGIVEQHQGWIEVESRVGLGTVFRIYLPHLGKSASAKAECGTKQRERGGTETILLVEDEAALRQMARKILERHGYRVYEAASAPAALSVWSEHRDQIALVLTDMVMPEGMNGWELGKRLQAEKPALKVIYSSGYTDEMLGEASALRGTLNFLEKPYGPVEILREVRACLDAV